MMRLCCGVCRFIRETRKTKYFWHGQLDWDPDSPDARYVRELRKLKVSPHSESLAEGNEMGGS